MPQSQRTPIERREVMKPGKTSTLLATAGSNGISSIAVCVEAVREPSGSVTVIGCSAGWRFFSMDASLNAI
jgi:hypothetical protein